MEDVILDLKIRYDVDTDSYAYYDDMLGWVYYGKDHEGLIEWLFGKEAENERTQAYLSQNGKLRKILWSVWYLSGW